MARSQASLQVAAGAAPDDSQLQMGLMRFGTWALHCSALLHACASVNKLLPTSADSTGDYDAGEEICDRAETLGVRAVVLLHHGKGMMQEMLFGEYFQRGVIACRGRSCSACCTLSRQFSISSACC